MQFKNPRPNGSYTSEDDAIYVLNWTNIAPTLTGVQATKQINADSDFYVQKLSYWASSAGAFVANPLLEWMWTDGGANKNLFSDPVFLEMSAGSGQLPLMLPQNRMFSANSTIQGTLYNLTSATTYDYVQILFIGVRAYISG